MPKEKMSSISATVSGVQAVTNSMLALNRQMTQKLIKEALKPGARIVQKKQQAQAPVSKKGSLEKTGSGYVRGRRGRLKRAIKIKTSKIHQVNKNGKLGFFVSISPGKTRRDMRGAWYGQFVDLGYKPKSKKHVGREVVEKGLMTEREYKATLADYGKRNKQMAIKTGRKKVKAAYVIRRTGGGAKVPGKNFMRDGFNSSNNQAAAAIETESNRLIEQAAQQLGFRLT